MAAVAEGEFGMHLVVVAPARPHPGQVPAVAKVGHDSLGRPFGDPDAGSNVSQPDGRVGGYAEQHVPVVGHERPLFFHRPGSKACQESAGRPLSLAGVGWQTCTSVAGPWHSSTG